MLASFSSSLTRAKFKADESKEEVDRKLQDLTAHMFTMAAVFGSPGSVEALFDAAKIAATNNGLVMVTKNFNEIIWVILLLVSRP